MLKPIRNIDLIDTTIRLYLSRNQLTTDDTVWEIRKSPLGGFGVFAKRPIEIGEIIFKDRAVILGPRAAQESPPICVNCYNQPDTLEICKNCGVFLCELCGNSDLHSKECRLIRLWQNFNSEVKSSQLSRVLTPIRSLLLDDSDKAVVLCLKAHRSDQHGFEVDIMKSELNFNLSQFDEEFMRLVCSVLDSNAFEVVIGNEEKQTSVRGLYPLASLVNHNCSPNTTHVFDQQQHMIVRAAKFIDKDAEISHSYSRVIWGTMTRRYHLLRTKHFLCKCKRCSDPTEFHTYMSSVLCKSCNNGNVLPPQSLQINTNKWQCESCKRTYKRTEIASITSILGSILTSFDNNDYIYMMRFIQQKLPKLVSDNHEIVVELKYRIIWIFGHAPGLTLHELPDDLLLTKENYCRDLLDLLERLDLGQCKMRGLLLHELYSVLKERIRRNSNLDQPVGPELETLLEESADILMYDVTAPQEIKTHPVWKSLCI